MYASMRPHIALYKWCGCSSEPSTIEVGYTGASSVDISEPCRPRTHQRATLSEHDIVRRRSPCITPSQVCSKLLQFFTGIVPSPDSIFVRSCPRANLLGCRSGSCCSCSCGLNIRPSPQGAVLTYMCSCRSGRSR